jgi:lysophospholipase L1-like esterase
MRIGTLHFLSIPVSLLGLAWVACDGSPPAKTTSTGGVRNGGSLSTTGGATGIAGVSGQGGSLGTGGIATGGIVSGGHSTGGATTGGRSNGGTTITGGISTTGGVAPGGDTTGGITSAGGATTTGGISASGGSFGTSGAQPDASRGPDAPKPDAGADAPKADMAPPTPDTRTMQNFTIWIAGDSTVATHNAASGTSVESWGWGGQFDSLFNSYVTVTNSAVAGRSVRTWLYDVSSAMGSDGECTLNSNTMQSRWTTMQAGMKADDYLFIQFGINDGDTTCPRHVGTTAFKTALGVMAKAANDVGATPVFLTSVNGLNSCTWSSNRGFLAETKAAATQYGAVFIDLNALSIAYFKSIACTAATALFADGRTHFTEAGALAIAKLVAGELKTQKLPIAAYLK